MNSIKKLGVFDSGLGGLTVLNEICKYNGGLSISYFGDTARVPYGSRTSETILRYAEQDVRFLLSRNVEGIVIACGTVSSTCLAQLRERCRIPIIGVIEPAAKEAAFITKTGHVGVLGTKATVRSSAYTKQIQLVNPNCKVTGIACPLFVPLIENGFSQDDQIVKLTIERYLEPIDKEDIDTLILGCTHYPFLEGAISEYLPNVRLINIGTVLAKHLQDYFELSSVLQDNEVEYYVSDRDEEFQSVANSYLDAICADHVRKVDIGLY